MPASEAGFYFKNLHSFSFLVMPFSDSGIRITLSSQNELESVPSASLFRKSLCGVGISASLAT